MKDIRNYKWTIETLMAILQRGKFEGGSLWRTRLQNTTRKMCHRYELKFVK
jgi:hypothetical protein